MKAVGYYRSGILCSLCKNTTSQESFSTYDTHFFLSIISCQRRSGWSWWYEILTEIIDLAGRNNSFRQLDLLRCSLFTYGSIGFAALGRFFQFINLRQSIGLLDGGSARRKAATYTQNKRIQTSVLSVGFELTIQAFERAKTIHALDRTANVLSLDAV
jgi:hypothetical protein